MVFVVGAAWAAVYGVLVATLGDEVGFPVACLVMAARYLVAILFVVRIRAGGRPTAGIGGLR